MPAQYGPHGRRSESLRYTPIVGCCYELCRIGARRPRKVHLRQQGRDSHCRIEECKQGEAGKIDAARLDAIGALNLVDLRVEHVLSVQNTLWPSRAAGCENNGRRVVDLRRNIRSVD